MVLRVGVDVGGTFTDLVVFDSDGGTLAATKVPTDYRDPLAPISEGLNRLTGGREIDFLHHATTLATNAVIEGRLPTGLLLTTMGFRDVLDIGRIQRPEAGIYDFNVDNPQPLIERALRVEVIERIGAHGEIVTELDEDDLRAKLQEVRARDGAEDISAAAVCCLFSFINPDHEKRIGEILSEEWPELHVSLSHVISPEIREFERSSTVVLDALLKPVLTPYLRRFDQGMAAENVRHSRIMMASGGLTSCDEAADRPVTILNSGPSAGVIASACLGRAMGMNDFVTIDMGGTSLDIGLIEGGRSVMKFEGEIAGYPLRMPTIDVAAIAAGGGSLALIDEIGMIQVDRESAGSNPGPASYGRGGKRPTITDADLLLGRLSAVFDADNGLVLTPDLAEQAFQSEICRPLGVDLHEAATSVLEIIQARMAKAIASNTVQKGIDIRSLPLFVYGGAGPVHGVELAETLNMNRVIVPHLASNFSALGLLLCPLRWDISEMVLRNTSDMSEADLASIVARLEGELMEKAGRSTEENLETKWIAHMRYHGQSYDLIVEADDRNISDGMIPQLVDKFHQLHDKRYAYCSVEEEVEIVQLRVSVIGPEQDFPRPVMGEAGDGIPLGGRDVYFTSSRARVHTDIWARRELPPGAEISGPAMIEDQGSSILIPAGWTGTVDQWLNIDIRRTRG